jgi:hypothetical protein
MKTTYHGNNNMNIEKFISLILQISYFIKKTFTFAAPKAHVVKLVDTSDLGSDAARCGGSSPSMRTFFNYFLKRKCKKPCYTVDKI